MMKSRNEYLQKAVFIICVFLFYAQPAQFEQCVVQMLQSLKEPLEIKPGEINVRKSPTVINTITRVAEVSVESLPQLAL